MKCPVCNKRNKKGIAICDFCGAKLPIENLVPEDNEKRNLVDSYKISISKGLLTGIIISVVVVIGILIFFLVRPENKKTGEMLNQDKKEQNMSIESNNGTMSSGQEKNTVQSSSPVKSSANRLVTGKITDYRLRVRSRPSLRSAIVDHLYKGAEVIILRETEEVKIRVGNKYLTGKWYYVKWDKTLDEGRVKTVKGWVWGNFLKINR
jgi:hypothetical protein